ncbi:MAG: DEAD/DEAH box helicase [Oscillospiraceae bacterium]|nr:DEAD/DEAH box helicase [Oscillospiraceae bacterium]
MIDNKFKELGLKSFILRAIEYLGFEEPSQIQTESIPLGLKGYDLIGQAQTGTGKTMAFASIVLSNMEKNKKGIKTLVITPTRELAIQVQEEFRKVGKYAYFRSLCVYGGQPIEMQIRSLQYDQDIIVGTPGRILDHISRGTLSFPDLKFLIIDEADEMLNMGFIEDVNEIIKGLPVDRQTMLFSATMPQEIRDLSRRYMKNDRKYISIVKNSMTVDKVNQYFYETKDNYRFEILCRILDRDEPESALIFCKTKKGVDELISSLLDRGYSVDGMHGDMTQSKRLSALSKFKNKTVDYLVATDVAARGIDIEGISHVINYDLPQDTESYVHRVGRTGRANKEGIAVSLVTPKEYMVLKDIEKNIRSKIYRREIPTIDEIFLKKSENVLNTIKETLSTNDFKEFIPLALQLDEDYNMIDVSAALLKLNFQNQLSYDYKENDISGKEEVRLFISIGRSNNLNIKKLLSFIEANCDIDTDEVRNIRILENFSFITIPERYKEIIMRNCNYKILDGAKVRIQLARPKENKN